MTADARDARRRELEAARETEIIRVLQRVGELPDRTSPDEWPEAMLVTPDELRLIVAEALDAYKQATRRDRDALLAALEEIGRLSDADDVHWALRQCGKEARTAVEAHWEEQE